MRERSNQNLFYAMVENLSCVSDTVDKIILPTIKNIEKGNSVKLSASEIQQVYACSVAIHEVNMLLFEELKGEEK